MPADGRTRVVPRAEHTLSRSDIDPDALKVLYRLRQGDHIAYLVGGSVRDLLLGRQPKDFDIGTSAHPYQVKKLFRNCWIIGRRFRLAHVKFGNKVIEVATFRRQSQVGTSAPSTAGTRCATRPTRAGRRARRRHAAARVARHARSAADPPRQHVRHARGRRVPARLHDQRAVLRHRDVFGHRLRRRARRSAGRARPLHRRPGVRFREDPVRMLRAVALAARLDFTIDRPILDAIARAAPRDREQLARRGCSRSTTRFCGPGRPRRPSAGLPKPG